MSDRHGTNREQNRRRRRPGAGWRSQRGAVLVEAAIILPVVLTLILGVMEFGFIWKDDLAIANGVHAAARIGAASGNDQSADLNILQQIKAGTSALPNGGVIQGVIVWKATYAPYQSSPPSQCTDLIGLPSQGKAIPASGIYCNYYLGTDVQNLGNLTFNGNCFSSSDHWWPAVTTCTGFRTSTLDLTLNKSPDLLGVYIRINHNYVTKILGTSRTLSDQAIMRIEPQ